LRELSTDAEDMIAFVRGLPESDDDDAQALLEELSTARPDAAIGPLRADYQRDRQLLGPRDTLRMLGIPRPTFYALIKRGTFPAPLAVDDNWTGWPRDMLVGWADASEGKKLANVASMGYAPFERYLPAKSRT